MLNISIVQITVIGVIVAASILVGKWLGRKSNPKIKEPVNVLPRKVKFFTSAKDRDTTIFMLSVFLDGVATGVVVCRTYRRRDSFIGIGFFDYRYHHDGHGTVS